MPNYHYCKKNIEGNEWLLAKSETEDISSYIPSIVAQHNLESAQNVAVLQKKKNGYKPAHIGLPDGMALQTIHSYVEQLSIEEVEGWEWIEDKL